MVTDESIGQWCRKFGQTFANGLRRRRPRPGDKWHLDEVFIKIQGKSHYLWRAVDQDGTVLDLLATSRRDAKAATRFFRKLLRGLRYVPRVLVTDKLASYGVAHRRLMRSVAVPVRVQRDITPLPTPPPPTHRSPVPTRDDHPLRHLERGRWPARGRLTPSATETIPGSDTRHHTGPPTT